MTLTVRIATALTAFLVTAVPLAAQAPPQDPTAGGATAQEDKAVPQDGRPITLQHFRPMDQRGINMFETPKDPGVEYTGFKVDFGAAFASQVQ